MEDKKRCQEMRLNMFSNRQAIRNSETEEIEVYKLGPIHLTCSWPHPILPPPHTNCNSQFMHSLFCFCWAKISIHVNLWVGVMGPTCIIHIGKFSGTINFIHYLSHLRAVWCMILEMEMAESAKVSDTLFVKGFFMWTIRIKRSLASFMLTIVFYALAKV